MKHLYLFTTLALLLFLLPSCTQRTAEKAASADSAFPPLIDTVTVPLDSSGEVDPCTGAGAVKGGTYTTWGSSFPKSLNYWLDNNSFSAEVMSLLFENLVSLHSTEDRAVGGLAHSWETGDDKKTYTFTIHPAATWSDGTPVTATDVQFYYDVIMNPKNMTSLFRVDLKRFDRPEIVDDKTVRIVANESHWSNFWSAAAMTAFPKHAWDTVDFNKQNFDFPVVSGPYRIKEINKSRSLTLQRRVAWWGKRKQYSRNKYNFDYIRYKFMEDRVKALEAFKTGIFDAYAVYTSSIWMKQTHFESVEKGWVSRQQIYNKEPIGFQGFAINMREKKFQDVRVRAALCHLLNRELMNEKLMFNQYFLLNSYYPDLYPGNRNPEAPLRGYNPEKARALLAKAGWKVDENGKLTKDGQPFDITFVTYSVDHRHLNIYIEDLKKVGINPSIEQLSLSTFRKRIDNHDFDMTWMAWGASRLRDPEASWHSSTANEIATNNVTGVQNAVIDSLIEVQKTEMDLAKRNDILRHIDTHLSELIPYVLLWQSDHHRLLYWNKFGTPESVLGKFNREDAIPIYWWMDSTQAATLSNAMESGSSLPSLPEKVSYSE